MGPKIRKTLGLPVGSGGKPMPYSLAVRAGDFVFVAGRSPLDKGGKVIAGDIDVQARAVLGEIKQILSTADCTMADVVKTTVWLVNADDFARFNEIYAEFFPSDPPARSTVQSNLMVDARVEIEALAYSPLQ